MNDFLKLPFSFDTNKLKSELQRVNEEFILHINKSIYSGEWSAISLRSMDGSESNIYAGIGDESFSDTPLLQKLTYIKEIVEGFKCEKEAIRFMKLSSGANISEHTDAGLSFSDGAVRVHIPIETDERVKFFVNGNLIQMAGGETYYIDAGKKHSVINESDRDRIHLVLDLKVNEWLKTLFFEAGFIEIKPKYGSNSINDDNVDEIIFSLEQMGTDVALKMAQKFKKIKGE